MKTATIAYEFIAKSKYNTILDIGSGDLSHANGFKSNGKTVTTVDMNNSADIQADFMKHEFNDLYDCVWTSHVLEHQQNPGLFLQKAKSLINEKGVLAITVPPRKDNIVGGHVTLWNAGLLLYNLILVGFDCSNAKVKTYGYNISVVVENSNINLPSLTSGKGDLEALNRYFPIKAEQNMNGVLKDINW